MGGLGSNEVKGVGGALAQDIAKRNQLEKKLKREEKERERKKAEKQRATFNQSTKAKMVPKSQTSVPHAVGPGQASDARQNDNDLLMKENWNDEFEGGEEEKNEMVSEVREDKKLLDEEDEEEEIDPEVALQYEDEADAFLNKKMRYLNDWRDEMTVFKAFFVGRLRGNDYQIIISLIVSIAMIIAMAGIVCY